MDLSCPTCAFTTTIPDGQLPPEGTRARCPSCGRVSVFLRGLPIVGGIASNPVSYYFSFIAFHVMGRTAEMAEQKIDWS